MRPAEAATLDDVKARERLVRLRWPGGVLCPRCGGSRTSLFAERSTRPGTWKCGDCNRQFTVATDTVFEKSRIPLRKWILAVSIACHSERGVSALELQRRLGLRSYRTAWRLAHRLNWLRAELAADRASAS